MPIKELRQHKVSTIYRELKRLEKIQERDPSEGRAILISDYQGELRRRNAKSALKEDHVS